MLRFLKALLGAVLVCVLLASCDAALESDAADSRGRVVLQQRDQRPATYVKSRVHHPGTRAHTEPKRRHPPSPAPRTFRVSRVVDGDTLELGNGEAVRLVGIDTPEIGECGYDRASVALGRLVAGRQVRLTRSDEDRDRYGRLLRYVDVGGVDAGLRQIRSGLAIARYDSRDGYGFHPREPRYIAADDATRHFSCPKPTRRPDPSLWPAGAAPAPRATHRACRRTRPTWTAPTSTGRSWSRARIRTASTQTATASPASSPVGSGWPDRPRATTRHWLVGLPV